MQYEKKTKYTEINTNKSLWTVKWAQCDKTQSRDCKKCSHKCAYNYAQLQYTIKHRTVELLVQF